MIANKNTRKHVTVDLDGPEGNAFVLLGMAKSWSKQLGLDWAGIEQKMTSGDYRNLVLTMEKYFGSFVRFETSQKDLLKRLKSDRQN